MPILVTCSCGARLNAPEALAGRQAQCGQCGSILHIPRTSARPTDDEARPAGGPLARTSSALTETKSGAGANTGPQWPQAVGPEDRASKPDRAAPNRPVDPDEFLVEPADLIDEDDVEAEPGEDQFEPVARPARRRLPRKISAPRRRKQVFQGAVADEPQTPKVRTVAAAPKKAWRKEPGLLDVWTHGLKFPFRREALITIFVLSLLYGPAAQALSFAPGMLAAGAFGIKGIVGLGVISLGILGYFCFFLLQVLRSAASNEDDLPVAAAFDFEEIFADLWLMLGGTLINFLPLLIPMTICRLSDRYLPGPLYWGLLGVTLTLWPFAVASSALHTSALGANPWTVGQAVVKIPVEYLLTLLLALGLTCTAYVLGYYCPKVIILTGLISWFLLFLTLVSWMYLFGNLYYRHRRRIGWFGELAKQY